MNALNFSPRKPRKHEEDDFQRAVVQLLHAHEAMGELRFFAVPNGGKRSAITGAIMQRLGTRPGVPDVVVLVANGGPTVFLELKSSKGKVSDTQHNWTNWLTRNGRPSFIVRSIEQVEGILKAVLLGQIPGEA